MPDCLFCNIVKSGEGHPLTYEDELVVAFLDKYPLAPGHTLVVPRQHFENIFDVSDEILTRIILVSKKLAKNFIEEGLATAVNIRHASGADAGQSVFHIHFHVLPRRPNDGLPNWFHTRERG
jgi:histidine triad (HIT) family protein